MLLQLKCFAGSNSGAVSHGTYLNSGTGCTLLLRHCPGYKASAGYSLPSRSRLSKNIYQKSNAGATNAPDQVSAVQENMEYHKLVRDTLRSKPEAQRELYEHFAQQMLGVCFRYTKSISDAEDVLQEGFVKVFKHLHQYNFE